MIMKNKHLSITVFVILVIFIFSQEILTQVYALPKIEDLKSEKQIDVEDIKPKLRVDTDFEKTPLYFIPNKGQVSNEVCFYAMTSAYTLWATKAGLVFDRIMKNVPATGAQNLKTEKRDQSSMLIAPRLNQTFNRDVSRFQFLNANKDPEIFPSELSEYRVNYFVGKDKSRWRTGIVAAKAIVYKELYNKIDLKIYGVEKQIEYDWIIYPGGEVSNICFKYENAEKIKIDDAGDLLVQTELGELKHARPVCYQIINGRRKYIGAGFKKIEKNSFGFTVEKYDQDYALIIDPLIYSSYLGGSITSHNADDKAYGIVVDKKRFTYITGETSCSDFPTKNPYQKNKSGWFDVFVTKMKRNGGGLVYSTFIGGDSFDQGNTIAVDDEGCVYLAGYTKSSNFPVKNPFQNSIKGAGDLFMAKLNVKGNALIYSTYLGGSDDEYIFGQSLAVDRKGNACLTGYTRSRNFPTEKALQGKLMGYEDAFIAKLGKKGNKLIFSTYLGGDHKDRGQGLVVDKKGNIYVSGVSQSQDFPLKNPLQDKNNGYADFFIVKIKSSGKTLLYSTYLGGSCYDIGHGIAIDDQGSVYVTGKTSSSDFPLQNPFDDTVDGPGDVAVVKINSKGDKLLYSTYMGGNDDEGGVAIVLHKNSVCVTGVTSSTDFPEKNPVQRGYGGNLDAFVFKLDLKKNILDFSTYLGGSQREWGFSLAVDNRGAVYAVGETYSTDFPLKKAFQGDQKGIDGFVTKIK